MMPGWGTAAPRCEAAVSIPLPAQHSAYNHYDFIRVQGVELSGVLAPQGLLGAPRRRWQ